MTNAFLLTRQWRDTRDGLLLDYWWATPEGPVCTQITAQPVVMFIAQERKQEAATRLAKIPDWHMSEVDLRTYRNQPVVAVYFRQHRHMRDARDLLTAANITCWETDIKPTERYLMERFITATAVIDSEELPAAGVVVNPRLRPLTQPWRPALNMMSIDIETSMDAKTLFSIAYWCNSQRRVFVVGEGESQSVADGSDIVFCSTPKQCLEHFFRDVDTHDPDLFIGWNLVQFDLWVLENHCKAAGLRLALGRAQQPVHWRQEFDEAGRRFITIPGRVALDGIELLKAAYYRYDSYALASIAPLLLGEQKLLEGPSRGEDIAELYQNDPVALAAYNLKDCELVWKIFETKALIDFAMERSCLTGLLLDRIGGSVAAFEYLYLPRLHRKGYIAPNMGELVSDVVSPGGYVMDSRPGIYDNVLVLDFKSLYPSIMRTFLIDPSSFWRAQHDNLSEDECVPGFNGAYFSREHHILPSVIEQLSNARDEAKRHKNAPLSHAIKIIMNSFYGVLGSTGCRFFDPRVSSSITLRGHEIIQRSREWIETQGYAVIYGDTDSLFVWLENNCQHHSPKSPEQCHAIGQRLARELNVWWKAQLHDHFQIKSALEIQFETHYLRFLMPTIRGSDVGTKKRYAGLIEQNGVREMVFKGLENVRTDWTPLAKEFQSTLYEKIFAGDDYLDFVRQTHRAVQDGLLDHKLVYRKRLRQPLVDYVKNIPPHVQAARKWQERQGETLGSGDWISYCISTQGPEPVGTLNFDLSLMRYGIDYRHYIDKQLTPVADSILHFLEKSLEQLVDQQLSLFENKP